MRILVLGGDGYLGWPTALHLSACGHDVAVADNFARRGYDHELGVDSLVPIETLQTRVAVWREHTGNDIKSYIGDLVDASFTYHIVEDFRPDAVVHFAEQHAAIRLLAANPPLLEELDRVIVYVVAVQRLHRDDGDLCIGLLVNLGGQRLELRFGLRRQRPGKVVDIASRLERLDWLRHAQECAKQEEEQTQQPNGVAKHCKDCTGCASAVAEIRAERFIACV